MNISKKKFYTLGHYLLVSVMIHEKLENWLSFVYNNVVYNLIFIKNFHIENWSYDLSFILE